MFSVTSTAPVTADRSAVSPAPGIVLSDQFAVLVHTPPVLLSHVRVTACTEHDTPMTTPMNPFACLFMSTSLDCFNRPPDRPVLRAASELRPPALNAAEFFSLHIFNVSHPFQENFNENKTKF